MGPRPALHGDNDPGGLDLYIGGVEHAVLHLLYSRFWHKVLFDLGYVTSAEPYRKLFNQGMIQAFAYTDSRGVYVPAEEVTESGGKFFYNGEQVNQEYGKMGKSLKNSVAPTTSAATTAPTPCACTRCSWARSISPGRGPPRTSSAPSVSCSGCGVWSSTRSPARSASPTPSPRRTPSSCCTRRSPVCAKTSRSCETTPPSPS